MVIDCTHIQISDTGGKNAEFHWNRKGWMSFTVQIIAGPNLQIVDIVAKRSGSTHDSRISKNSFTCDTIQQFIVSAPV